MALKLATWVLAPMLIAGSILGINALLGDEDALPTEQHVQLRDGRDIVFLQDPDGAWHLVPDGKEMDNG